MKEDDAADVLAWGGPSPNRFERSWEWQGSGRDGEAI